MAFVSNELALERGEERRLEREAKLGDIGNFLSSELNREEALRRSFVDGEIEREREYTEALDRFVHSGFERQYAAQERVVSVGKAVVDRAVTDERVAFEAASGFLDNEVCVLVLSVCLSVCLFHRPIRTDE